MLGLILGFYLSPGVTLAQHLAEPRQWVVAVPANYPPYYSVDQNNQPVGFAIDVFDAVAARAGLHYRYAVKRSFEEVLTDIREGRADIVPNLGVMASRAQFVDYTSPNITFSVSLFTRASNSDIRAVSDLRNRRVAVVKDNAAVELVDRLNDVTVDSFSEVEIAFYALISGQVDALAYPEPVMWQIAEAIDLDDKIRMLTPPLGEIKRAIAISKQAPELHETLELAFQAFLISDQYNELYRKWFNNHQEFWDAKRVFWFMSGLLVIVIAVLTIQRHRALLKLNASLQEQIDQATYQLSESNRFLQDLTVTDALTGISNRRAFEHSLEELMERARRYSDFFSMLIFDIDNFKLLNDQFGHDMGDRVLKDLVERIAGVVRNVDVFCRWGGEEFTILMPKTDRDGALHMAERCRRVVADELFDEVGAVTISVGVTCFLEGDNERRFFKRADDALYQAKAEGKNRVVWNGKSC